MHDQVLPTFRGALTVAASTIFLFRDNDQRLQSMKVAKVIARLIKMTAVKDICRQFTSLAEKKIRVNMYDQMPN